MAPTKGRSQGWKSRNLSPAPSLPWGELGLSHLPFLGLFLENEGVGAATQSGSCQLWNSQVLHDNLEFTR